MDDNENTPLTHAVGNATTYSNFFLPNDGPSENVLSTSPATVVPSVNLEKETCLNSYMLSSKIAYFLNNAKYSILEYWVLFYVSTGLNPADAGFINGVQIIGGTIAAPIWGFLADRRQCHRIVIVILCVFAMVSTMIQPFLSERYGDDCKTVCRHQMNVLNESAYVACNQRINEVRMTTSSVNDKNALFYSLLIASSVASIFDGSILSFVDSGVLHRIRSSPTPCEYGHQRLFGSLGYGTGAVIYSATVNNFPEGDISCYTGLFVVYFVVTGCLVLSSYVLFSDIKITSQNEVTMSDLRQSLMSVATNLECIFVFLTILVNGTFQGLWYAFLFIYLKELNGPTMLLGWSLLVTALSGTVVYVIANTIINLLSGPIHAMALTSAIWTIRFICLSYLQNPFYILLIDIIHGFTFSLFRVASLVYIKEVADPVVLTTLCGVNNTLNSCGLVLANLIGGRLYKQYGGRKLFFGSSLLCMIWSFLIVCFVVGGKVAKRNSNPSTGRKKLIGNEAGRTGRLNL